MHIHSWLPTSPWGGVPCSGSCIIDGLLAFLTHPVVQIPGEGEKEARALSTMQSWEGGSGAHLK